MKISKINLWLFAFVLFLAGCQPDPTTDPTPSPTGINFVGTWNRDSVLVNDVAPSGLKSRLESEANYGKYTFNSDNQTGVLNLSGTDFAITWNYNSSANTIRISEIDWMNQLYVITQLSSTKFVLTGLKDVGGGFQNERIIYLSKQ